MRLSIKIVFLFVIFAMLFSSCENDIECMDLNVTIELTGGNILQAAAAKGKSPYSYNWSNGEVGVSQITVTTLGNYVVTVFDGNDCSATATYTYDPGPGSCGSTTSVADAGGNLYDVVSIGTQCWMVQNLKMITGIPQVSDTALWAGLTTPAFCYYGNDMGSGSVLYNWYAVKSGNICPSGWHIPTSDEWNVLLNYLGGSTVAGGKMKTLNYWTSPNTGATNSSGFSARPMGYRALSGGFWDINSSTVFWSSTTNANDSTVAWKTSLSANSALAATGWSDKRSGYSCRCIKD